MIDNNITRKPEGDNSTKREKIKAIYPHIVVSGNIENLYYSIQWYDIEKKSMQDGYGSYTLENVRQWLKDDFDVIDDDIDNLINRLETENKALNRDNDRLLEEIQDVKESERKTAKKYHAKLIDAYKKLKTARTEAVKEFAERLKGLSFQTYKGCFAYEITEENLNNLLKEMVGDAE